MKSGGANVWLDQLDIQPGQRWARAVQDALNNSPRLIVILSPSSASSTNVEDEVTFALEEHKTIIPVLYRDCKVPFQLRPFQYVDFRTDYARALDVMLKTLRGGPYDATDHTQLKKEDDQQSSAEGPPEQHRRKQMTSPEEVRKGREERELPPQERSSGSTASAALRSVTEFPTWTRILLALCGVLVAAAIFYWAARPRQPLKTESPNPATSSHSPSGQQASAETAVDNLFNGTWLSPEDGYRLKLNIDADDLLTMSDSLGFHYVAKLGIPTDFHRDAGASGGTGGVDATGILVKRKGNVLDVIFFHRDEKIGHQTVTVAADGKTLAFKGQFNGESAPREFTMVKQ
jgi:hypothetical protein